MLKSLPSFEYEYAVKFELNGSKFTTPKSKGFSVRSSVENEIRRLSSAGAMNIKVFIRKWS